MKRENKQGIPITDSRVTPIFERAVNEFCEALKKCKDNPDYLYTGSAYKTDADLRGDKE